MKFFSTAPFERAFGFYVFQKMDPASPPDLEYMGASVEPPLASFDRAKFVLVNGQLVGTTATINEDEITRTIGERLDGYHPLTATYNG